MTDCQEWRLAVAKGIQEWLDDRAFRGFPRWIWRSKYLSPEFDIWYGSILPGGKIKVVFFYRNDRGAQEHYVERTLGLDGVDDVYDFLLTDPSDADADWKPGKSKARTYLSSVS